MPPFCLDRHYIQRSTILLTVLPTGNGSKKYSFVIPRHSFERKSLHTNLVLTKEALHMQKNGRFYAVSALKM